MGAAPKQISNMRVVLFSPIDGRHRHTGNCRTFVNGVLQGSATGLAICRDERADCFYLFGCDEDWNNVTDTWHKTLEDAMHQAEFEYEGISGTWQQHD